MAKGSTIDTSAVVFPDVEPETARKLQRRLAEAGGAFERERFGDSERLTKSVLKLAPGTVEAIELLGLCYYRMGRWGKSITQLEKFEAMTNSVEQHPVLADCYRAQEKWGRVDELWQELGAASPGSELVEEGRIVYAESLADRGQLTDAIRQLERAPKMPRKPKVHHLRRWYALADLYERAGDFSRARRAFAEIDSYMPGFGDAKARSRRIS